MEEELNKINELIGLFNDRNLKFELELRIINREFKVYMKLDYIVDIIFESTGITHEQINTNSRAGKILLARQMSHYIASKNTKYTLAKIGEFFGNRDHATVKNSITKIQNDLETNKEFRDTYGIILNSSYLKHTDDNS